MRILPSHNNASACYPKWESSHPDSVEYLIQPTMGQNQLAALMTHRRRKQVDDHHTCQNQGDTDDCVDIELLTVDKPR